MATGRVFFHIHGPETPNVLSSMILTFTAHPATLQLTILFDGARPFRHLCTSVSRLNVTSVGVGRMFESVCLFICLSVCPEHNSKTNDPKVFKLGIENDLGIP